MGTTQEEIVGDNAPYVQVSNVGVCIPRALTKSSSNDQESNIDAGQRPSMEGLHVCTPRRNVVPSSNKGINFPELVQFMMMDADAESHTEQRCHEESEEIDDRHQHEHEEVEERYRHQREEAEDRREQRMMTMMQMFMSRITDGDDDSKDN